MMLRSNKANMAKDGGMKSLSLLPIAWDGGILCELELSSCGRNHLSLCISCNVEGVGQLVVVTWSFMIDEGYLATQVEITLDILERKLWCWAYITHCNKWGDLPCVDGIWRDKYCSSIYFCSCLLTSNIFLGRTVIFPNFHMIFGILEFLINLINEVNKRVEGPIILKFE